MRQKKHERPFWFFLACVFLFCASPVCSYEINMQITEHWYMTSPNYNYLNILKFISPIEQSATFPDDNKPKAYPKECTIVTRTDNFSSYWNEVLCKGQEISKIEVILSDIQFDQNIERGFVYTFNNCYLKSIRHIADPSRYSEGPVDEITFIYKSVIWRYYDMDGMNAVDGKIKSWDFTTNNTVPTPTASHTPTFTPASTPTLTIGEVIFPTPTNIPMPSPTPTKFQIAPTPPPVNIPLGKVYVFDDLSSTENLVNGEDTDPENNRQLVIRWNTGETEAKDYHIYVGTPQMELSYLGRTAGGDVSYYEWKLNGENVSRKFINGPQNESLYHFIVFALGDHEGEKFVLGEYPSEGEVFYRVSGR